MDGHLTDDVVEVGANGRERFYDSRGYGRPRGDGVVLSRVEAAHLLYRGDLASVDGQGFAGFLADNEDVVSRFLVYADLRERGFYLSSAREGWLDDSTGGRAPGADGTTTTPSGAATDVDFVVHPRGDGPWDGTVEHRVRVVGERASVAAASLGDVVLAVVDEESEITYLDSEMPDVDGTSGLELDGTADGHLLEDRVLCWDPPTELYERGFYGQRMGRDDDTLQLSLLEAAHLVDAVRIAVEGGLRSVLERGRAVEGERFDDRLTVYRELRERGLVPKTGFKFGADFRTYAAVDDVADLGHSESLVRVLPADARLSPRDLALDVRLAHGVRKRMLFALVDGDDVRWRSVSRLTP